MAGEPQPHTPSSQMSFRPFIYLHRPLLVLVCAPYSPIKSALYVCLSAISSFLWTSLLSIVLLLVLFLSLSIPIFVSFFLLSLLHFFLLTFLFFLFLFQFISSFPSPLSFVFSSHLYLLFPCHFRLPPAPSLSSFLSLYFSPYSLHSSSPSRLVLPLKNCIISVFLDYIRFSVSQEQRVNFSPSVGRSRWVISGR